VPAGSQQGGPGSPRVRFAPSPTGFLHVGSARTALFNWLFARHSGGSLVLRIEDTDAERGREEWVRGIEECLSWLGLEADEGPVRQSSRAPRHAAAVDALWEAGALYACDCSREEVVARTAGRPTPGYDGFCRDRGLGRTGHALRFRTPEQGATVVHDLIRGDVVFPHEAMEDWVVVRATGQPLFVLANTVDDRDMAITHVVRGEDLLPSTPKGLLLWRALDSAPGAAGPVAEPVFAHLPMLVNERGQKLSKRRDDVAVETFRDQGYLADAFRNYLALLGWSPPGDAEKVPVDVLISTFRLEDVHRAPAFFDVAKLRHFNGEYLRELSADEVIAASRPWVDPAASSWVPAGSGPPWPAARFDPAVFATMAPLVQERVATLSEVPALVDFLFLEEPVVDAADWAKSVAGEQTAAAVLDLAAERYASCRWDAETLHATTGEIAGVVGRSLAKAQAPIRVAITGRRVGPPLFQAMEVLGRTEVLRRIGGARDRLHGSEAALVARPRPSSQPEPASRPEPPAPG